MDTPPLGVPETAHGDLKSLIAGVLAVMLVGTGYDIWRYVTRRLPADQDWITLLRGKAEK